MELILESERLLLRPLEETDVDLGFDLLTDPVVTKYAGKTYTRDEVVRQMPTIVRRCAGGAIGIWCVTDRATGEKLGTAILLPLPIEEDDTNWDLVRGDALPDAEIEIGYMFKPSAWGKGIATEACTRLLRFAFEQTPLEEVVAVTASENTPSQHVLRKSGLIHEGTRRAYTYDVPGFRITRTQWQKRQSATS